MKDEIRKLTGVGDYRIVTERIYISLSHIIEGARNEINEGISVNPRLDHKKTDNSEFHLENPEFYSFSKCCK